MGCNANFHVQSSGLWNSSLTCRITSTVIRLSSFPSWDVVFVSGRLLSFISSIHLYMFINSPSQVYIFVGSIMLHGHVLRYIAGSITGLTGLGYLALEFIPSIEPPATMREADPGWGAEQI